MDQEGLKAACAGSELVPDYLTEQDYCHVVFNLPQTQQLSDNKQYSYERNDQVSVAVCLYKMG